MAETGNESAASQDVATPASGAVSVKQTIVETLEAPRLTDVSTESFVKFKLRREEYEQRVLEKRQESGVDIPMTSYIISVDRVVLNLMIVAQWVPAETVTGITDEQLKECVAKRAVVAKEEYSSALIERHIRSVRMERGPTLEAQVWRLGLNYFKALEDKGYVEFVETCPEIAVKYILSRISHNQLRARMELSLRLRKEGGMRKNYNMFMRALADEEKALDRAESARVYSKEGKDAVSSSDEEYGGSRRAGRQKGGRGKKAGHRNTGGNSGSQKHSRGNSNSEDAGSRTGGAKIDAPAGSEGRSADRYDRSKRSKPECLNPKCKERHLVVNCPITSKEERENCSMPFESKGGMSSWDGQPQPVDGSL